MCQSCASSYLEAFIFLFAFFLKLMLTSVFLALTFFQGSLWIVCATWAEPPLASLLAFTSQCINTAQHGK